MTVAALYVQADGLLAMAISAPARTMEQAA